MMFIVLLFLLIDHIQPFEWNCTETSHVSLVNNEQCLILVEYISTNYQQRQTCLTDRLQLRTLPPPSYSSNYSMKTFRMNFCQLMTLSQLPFTFPSSLETLDLSSNLLSSFILAFPLPSSIKHLHLDDNPNLIEIHFGSKRVQENLITLTLRHNHRLQLSTLPESLKQLDLTDCYLAQSTMISTLFQSLKNLTHLSLADNQLEHLPIFEEKINFKYLNLSNNQLTFVDETWLHNNLEILDLRFNQINSLQFFNDRSSVKLVNLQFFLEGNPLSCDCYFAQILNSSSIHLLDASSLPCSSSSLSDLYCNYSQYCTIDCTCCEFEACDCHSICPWDCSCSHDALWTQHRIDCRERNFSSMHVLLPETMTELNYEGNHLEEINPLVFVGKVHLQKLNLARNNLRNFTNETFCSAKNLHEINFSTNPQLMTMTSSELNELFACLNSLQYIYLSHEQIHGEISHDWIRDDYGEIIRLKRRTSPSTTTTVFSILHQEFYTTRSFIEHHQAFLLLVFFLLLFLLLFSLLLISLAICRRKLREIQLKRTQLYHSNYLPSPPPPLPLTATSLKLPASQPTSDSLYEQLPSLSSDSEQPFLYHNQPRISPPLPPPALPPYPPVLVFGNCSNQQPILCQCVDRHVLYREKMNKN